jgi:hypothetical protein
MYPKPLLYNLTTSRRFVSLGNITMVTGTPAALV